MRFNYNPGLMMFLTILIFNALKSEKKIETAEKFLAIYKCLFKSLKQ